MLEVEDEKDGMTKRRGSIDASVLIEHIIAGLGCPG
jgi:hypothetical protein